MENNKKDGSQISESGNNPHAAKPATKIRIIKMRKPPEKQLLHTTSGAPGTPLLGGPISATARTTAIRSGRLHILCAIP
jgi:hypothetical protein